MICFDFFAQDLDWFQCHRSEMFLHCTARELQYSEQKIRPIQTNETLDFFDGNNIIKQKKAMLEKSKYF